MTEFIQALRTHNTEKMVYQTEPLTLNCRAREHAKLQLMQQLPKLLAHNYQRLAGVFDNLADDLAILDIAPDLLGQWVLRVIVRVGYVDVDARALAGKDFRVERLLSEVDGGAINLVQQDGWQSAKHLQGEVGTFNHIDCADHRVDDERCAGGVVQGQGICLAVDADGCVLAAGDEDGVVDLSVDFNHFRRAIEVVLVHVSGGGVYFN
jgi:ketosteroid isomerase-like protein